jgi:hypothetical protein
LTLHTNLLRDGYEAVAARVKTRLLNNPTHRHTLVVRGTGKACLDHKSKLADESVEVVVGTYDGQAPIEVLEGDLLCRLRELSAAQGENRNE